MCVRPIPANRPLLRRRVVSRDHDRDRHRSPLLRARRLLTPRSQTRSFRCPWPCQALSARIPTGTCRMHRRRRSLWLLNQMLQEPVDVIDLRLELCESGELNIELLADVGELFFNGREDLRSVRRRPRRSAQPSRAGTPGPTALASRAVFPLWSAWTGLCRHCGAILPDVFNPFLAPFPFHDAESCSTPLLSARGNTVREELPPSRACCPQSAAALRTRRGIDPDARS